MNITEAGSRSAWKAIMAASVTGVLLIGGCSSNPHFPDAAPAVNTSLQQNNLGAIHVSQDRNKGVLTLTGTVPSQSERSQAESIAKNTAPNYTVADEIAVVPPASNANSAEAAASDTDRAIEDNYKAELKKHRNLDEQDISVNAKNGAVVLSGTVKSESEKREAYDLAKRVPNVRQVVDELKVDRNKHSTRR